MFEREAISGFLPDLKRVIRKAGHLAKKMQEKSISRVTIKPDGSPVSDADSAVEACIITELKAVFPDIPVIGEETIDHRAPVDPGWGEGAFLVDPIDGTRAYVDGRGDYSVNIAFVQQGRVELGVIHEADRDIIYWGGAGQGAWLQAGQEGEDTPLHVRERESDSPVRFIASRYALTHGRLEGFLSEEQAYELDELSSSLKFCRIAQGEAEFYPRKGRTYMWDTAAGQAILEGAGGMVVRADTHAQLHYPLPAWDAVDFKEQLLNPDFYAVSHADLLDLTRK